MRFSFPALVLLSLSGAAHASDDAILKCRQIGDPAQRYTCYEAIEVGKSAPRPTNFGFFKPPEDEPKMIESEVPAHMQGWEPNQIITLANGQRWQIADGSAGTLEPGKRKVSIEKTWSGGFFMKFEGVNKQPAVLRLKERKKS